MLFAFIAGYFFKIPDPWCFHFCLVNTGLECSGSHFVQFGFPEIIGNGNLRKIHRLNLLLRLVGPTATVQRTVDSIVQNFFILFIYVQPCILPSNCVLIHLPYFTSKINHTKRRHFNLKYSSRQ